MDRVEKFWDNRSANFDGSSDEPDDEYVQFINKIKTHLKPVDSVLDFACGTGGHTLLISDAVREMHGIDISSKMIMIAKEKAAAQEVKNVSFSQATLFDESLSPGTYDAILAMNILHLLEDLQSIANRMYTLLKPGGLVIASTPALGEKRSIMTLLFRLVSKLNIVPNLGILRFIDIEKTFTTNGFRLVESKGNTENPPSYFFVAERSNTGGIR